MGVFTGLRLAEYAQSNLRPKQCFQTIPRNNDLGQWAGMALAFVKEYFTFYDQDNCCIPQKKVLTEHKNKRIRTVHIRFRFDKSATNFSIRKFMITDDMILNPVDAAVSIIRRAQMLGVLQNEPIGVYATDQKMSYHFLWDYHITPILRRMCVRAYPNPQHYLRIHIHRLVPHSNRVTAAVCLKMGGAKDEEIALRLRWKVASMPTYLRECFQEVGSIMLNTLQGAFKTS
jgi:hypothetical protein